MRVRDALLIGVVATVAIVSTLVWLMRSADAAGDRETELHASELAQDTSARAPQNVRVRVRVMNGTSTPGLARRGTQRLRDYGYDVVDYNTASKQTAETLVDVTADSREWGARIVRALGGGIVREQAEPIPYADVVVTLGSDWKPPAQPFRP